MKSFLVALFALALSAPAMASSLDLDVTGAKCSVTQKGDGDDARTSSECATGAQLPAVRWNLDGYTLFADLGSKDIGGEYAVCPGFKLGLSGGASTATSGGDEKHDSHATAYAKTGFELGAGKVDLKASASRTQAAGTLQGDGAGLSAKYFFSRSSITPFAQADAGYKWQQSGNAQSISGSLSFGMRATLK